MVFGSMVNSAPLAFCSEARSRRSVVNLMILAGVVRRIGQALITTIGRTAACATHPSNLPPCGRVRIDLFAISIIHDVLTVGHVVVHAGVHAKARQARYELPEGSRDDFLGDPFASDIALATTVVVSPSLTREAEYCENRG
jgi:hypothetical protein